MIRPKRKSSTGKEKIENEAHIIDMNCPASILQEVKKT